MTTFRDRRGRPVSADEFAAQIHREAMSEVRSALESAEDYEDFRDAMFDDPVPELSHAEIAAMSVEQIIENKEAVDAALARGPQGDVPLPTPAPTQRLATGMQPTNAGGGGGVGGPLTLQTIKGMSTAEINSRWSEVQSVLQAGR